MELNIGDKIKSLRLRNNLTQKELADRCELSKGFISQLESNQTSPSLSTLEDIVTTLGSSFREFFAGEIAEKPVFRKEDVFIKEFPEQGAVIHWLIPNAQKKDMEPIMLVLEPGGRSEVDMPHAGEEFGHVLAGNVQLTIGDRAWKARKGDSFSFTPDARHWLENTGKTEASVLWVSTPPTF